MHITTSFDEQVARRQAQVTAAHNCIDAEELAVAYARLQHEHAALLARVQELREALEESLALNKNVFSDAESETLAYYSEHRTVIAMAEQALQGSP